MAKKSDTGGGECGDGIEIKQVDGKGKATSKTMSVGSAVSSEGDEKQEWSNVDKARLRQAMAQVGESKPDWGRVAAFVGNHTGKQCQQHWVDVLQPELKKKGGLPKEELPKFRTLVEEHGQNPEVLADFFPGYSKKDMHNMLRRKEFRD